MKWKNTTHCNRRSFLQSLHNEKVFQKNRHLLNGDLLSHPRRCGGPAMTGQIPVFISVQARFEHLGSPGIPPPDSASRAAPHRLKTVSVRDVEVTQVQTHDDVVSSRRKPRVSMTAEVSVPVCRVREDWRRRRTSPRPMRYGTSSTNHQQLPRPET